MQTVTIKTKDRAIPPSWLEAPGHAAVDALELSPWARRALWASGAATVRDVRDLRLGRLAALPGVGPQTYCELDDLLDVLRARFRPPGMGGSSRGRRWRPCTRSVSRATGPSPR